jgi:hypothetical protein
MSDAVPQLSDATLYSRQLPLGRDHSEDAGFILTASADGYDLYLYACPYVVSGQGSGIWIVPDGRLNGTIFFAIPHELRGNGLRDNAFFRSGWHLPEYLQAKDLETVEEPGSTTWHLAGRRYVWKPGEWQIAGTHAGVATDLTVRPIAPPNWRWGPWDQLAANDSAGYKVSCLADGTIAAGGKTYRVRDGYATHERAAVGESRDIVAEVAGGAEVFAFEIRGEAIDIQVHRHTGRHIEAASVGIGDESFAFGMGSEGSRVVIATLENWQDPRSGLRIPARWHVAMSSARAMADLEIAASGRSYFHYNTRAGVMVMVQILGVANGAFHRAGGASVPIHDALVGLRWGRSLLFANEQG